MQIVLGLLALIIIAAFLAAKVEAISHERKMHILKITLLLFALLWLYKASVDHGDEEVRQIYNAFKQGKEVVCDSQPITQAHFYFETGTESFVSTDENGSLSGLVFPVSECEIKSE
jgi:hypothetical protein